MPRRIKAHRIRIYPDENQQILLAKTFGCCRLVYNLALEQRSVFQRPGRCISFVSWSAELKQLKDAAPFLREVPHHCLLQALKDLDAAYANFFRGNAAYPKERKKFDNESCRFPDPAQFRIGQNSLFLPKLGEVHACIHRPVQGRQKSITISRDGGHWYASILVNVRTKPAPEREILEGGFDLNVAQPVVESDGTVHQLPRVTDRENERKRRLQQTLARQSKGSKRRAKTLNRLRSHEARNARRRLNAAHQVSNKLTKKYTHLAGEALNLVNMTASAKGTVEQPGKMVAQKSGLNKALLDLAFGQVRRCIAYKAEWRGGVFVQVNPAYTSQTCSECNRHPKDNILTADMPHGRISRDEFVCPLCGFAADADVNAARVIRARGHQIWANSPYHTTTAGPAVAARRALSAKDGVVAVTVSQCETGKKFCLPSGLPQAA